jgi:hypothetical protein
MRLFQNSAPVSSYLFRLNQLVPKASRFRTTPILDDRFGVLKFLRPVLDGDADAFFTNGNDEVMQRHAICLLAVAVDLSVAK